MKKITFAAIACALVAGAANAGFQEKGQGGFMGNESAMTVSQVKEMKDDSHVILQGNIVRRINKDKYLFEDKTGSINVEIDKEDWRGQKVDPSNTVKLYGELDKGWFETEIDVDYVEKM